MQDFHLHPRVIIQLVIKKREITYQESIDRYNKDYMQMKSHNMKPNQWSKK